MQRATLSKVSAILTGDWHLREDVPICRTDDYWMAQWHKVDFIANLQRQYQCPVLCSGDLFDHWKPSPNLLRETIIHLPLEFYVIYGNHDLPQHNLQLVDKCGINVLQAAGKLTVINDGHWGTVPNNIDGLILPGVTSRTKRILVWHVMNYQGKKPWPDYTGPMAAGLLRKYSHDLILTGDNHKTFFESHEGRWLVNPGSLMRMDADQIDHKPCVFLWFAENNTIQQVFIPVEQGVISREHLDRVAERDGRIDAFISRVNTDWEADVSFEQNIETFEKNNQVRKSVMEIVYKSLEL
jgi:DNA repair exonuclease SbcCD nuclease subunit